MPTSKKHRSGPPFRARLKQIKLLLTDVDGVLTDGGLYISERGETKRFFVQDGLAQRLWQMAGLKIGWISARPSSATKCRSTELKTDFVIQTKDGKVPAAERILKQTGCTWEETCFIGDDVVDLALLRKVGLACAPANSRPEAIKAARYVTKTQGGNGAFREVVEMILKAQGKWRKLVEEVAR